MSRKNKNKIVEVGKEGRITIGPCMMGIPEYLLYTVTNPALAFLNRIKRTIREKSGSIPLLPHAAGMEEKKQTQNAYSKKIIIIYGQNASSDA